jgi:putative nucleotidyltransferase with HDIG domain
MGKWHPIMRTLYLIRHGKLHFGGEKRCIGHTDIPLSERGENQARRLSEYFDGRELTAIYTSPLSRARATAEYVSRGRWPVETGDFLIELNMGAWEGLTFTEIKQKFPELYEQRGQTPESCTPPGGETLLDAQTRAAAAVQHILSTTTGDIAVVAHAGINRLLIGKYKKIGLNEWMNIPQPYGGVTVLQITGAGIEVGETGRMPQEAPDAAECFELLRDKKTPQQVIGHCQAVAAKAEEIAADLSGRGVPLSGELVRAGALLHDIARAQPYHAQAGASWLIAEGYPKVAKLIAEHEDLPVSPAGSPLDESAVVYLADKLILGTEEVTLEERFARSLEKCRDKAARLAHEKRFRQALWVWERIYGNIKNFSL